MSDKEKGTTSTARMALMMRIKSGETRRSISADTGYSKQYLRQLWKAYQLEGRTALRPQRTGSGKLCAPRGKKRKELSPTEKRKIRKVLERRETPCAFEAALALIAAELGFNPLRSTVLKLATEWNIPMSPGPEMTSVPDGEFDGIWKKEHALRAELNAKMTAQDVHEWSLLGMPRGNRRVGKGAQWRKRAYEQNKRTYFCLEFWTAGPDALLNGETRQFLKKKIHFFSKHLGVEVLSYVIMDTHCFLLVTLPSRKKWLEKLSSPDQLLRRAEGLYQPHTLREMKNRLEKPKVSKKVIAYYQRDFCDLSVFVKRIKESVTRAHNRHQNTTGALWTERFRSLELTDREELMACLIRLNRWPLSRNLLKPEELEQYPWSSYGETMSGSKRAIKGVCRVLGISYENWKKPYPDDQRKGRKRLARNWFKSQVLSADDLS
jgi:REP element-mobilizing transposase RayT